MVNADKIGEVVSNLVRDRFPNAKIVDVKITEDTDYEDDVVLRVQVVFEPNGDTLDAAATSGFVRHLRPKLSDIGVMAFPVMSFVSERDVGAAA